MKQRGLIHPHMLVTLQPNFYPSRCTMQSANTSIDSHGDEISAPMAIFGLIDIPCRIAPASSREVRGQQQTFVEGLSQVSLAGYYPQIDSDMTPVIDGKSYAMEGEPESDGQHATTRFFVREVE